MSRGKAVLCARARMPMLWTAASLILVTGLGSRLTDGAWLSVLTPIAFALFAVAMALYLRVGTVRDEPLEIASPVAGRWVAVNSPAVRVPSHGLHAYGQTYAIDVVHDPVDDPRPAFGWWPLAARADTFPAFGQPVLAPADGVVAGVHDRERDHWSRNSWPAMLYVLVEGSLRELLGPGRILGNHVVLDLGGGRYTALAHLRRGSVRVRKGQRVAAGEQVAACGNSGNSTEPHVHFQVMDHPSVLFAAGLPFSLTRYETEDGVHTGVPGNGEAFVVPA